MMRPFEIRTADALLDAAFADKWRARESIDADARRCLRWILDAFAEGRVPIPVSAVGASAALEQLDREDLVAIHDGAVVLAYPFSAVPTAFGVTLADFRQRYGCCAVDALGIPPLLGVAGRVRSRCHHSRTPIDLTVTPQAVHGPASVMVWVGERRDLREKACVSL